MVGGSPAESAQISIRESGTAIYAVRRLTYTHNKQVLHLCCSCTLTCVYPAFSALLTLPFPQVGTKLAVITSVLQQGKSSAVLEIRVENA